MRKPKFKIGDEIKVIDFREHLPQPRKNTMKACNITRTVLNKKVNRFKLNPKAKIVGVDSRENTVLYGVMNDEYSIIINEAGISAFKIKKRRKLNI